MSTEKLVINRKGDNGQEVGLELIDFSILKGKREGTVYKAPEVTLENLDKVLAWIGRGNLLNEISTILKRKSQNIWFNAIGSDGVIDLTRFVTDMENFSTSGMKIKEIDDKLTELSAQLTKIVRAGVLFQTGTEADAAKAEATRLADEIRAYTAMREDRSRTPKVEEADEPAVTQ